MTLSYFVKAPRRNRPLLLLSGVGTNAIGYDLSPEVRMFVFSCSFKLRSVIIFLTPSVSWTSIVLTVDFALH